MQRRLMSDEDQQNRDAAIAQILPALIVLDPNISMAILSQTTINMIYLCCELIPAKHEEAVSASLHRLEDHINSEILHIREVFKK